MTDGIPIENIENIRDHIPIDAVQAGMGQVRFVSAWIKLVNAPKARPGYVVLAEIARPSADRVLFATFTRAHAVREFEAYRK